MQLRRLFHPASVAVVGATDRAGSYAGQTLLNLQQCGFPGRVYGVNPRRAQVLGRPCFPTLSDLPEPVDAVVVAIPAAGVPAVVEEAGRLGCGGAVVFSAGFAEVAAGVELQAELVTAARRHELPVVGPNCNGIVVPARRLALWGDALAPREPGSVALVSQSGNVAVNALGTARGLRFHTVVASGNQAVVSAADYLGFLADEEGLSSIALYLEDDGNPELCDGLAACVEAGIRLAVLKVGSSAAGARAAAAHSGALAGDQRVFRSLVEEAGAAWAEDVHELLELAKSLAVTRTVHGGLAIMTCWGGDSAQGADEVQRLGLELPELAESTRDRLDGLLPASATVANPLDYTAMIWGDTQALAELVRALGEDPAVGQVLVFYDQLPGIEGAAEQSWRAVRHGLMKGAAGSPAPTMVCSTLPELLDDRAAWEFAQAGIPAVSGLRTGLRCAAAMRAAPGQPARLQAIAAAARALAKTAGGDWLAEREAKEQLRAAGIHAPLGRIVGDSESALSALAELGGPVVLKLSAPTVRHKTELGAVVLGIEDPETLLSAHRRLSALAEALDGQVLIEAQSPSGIEVLIAARADGIVPVLVIGLGGVWTEVLADVAVIPLPVSRAQIETALRRLKGASLLTGGRGLPPVDIGALTTLAARVAELLLDGHLRLIELNPVIAAPERAVVVDALMQRSSAERGGPDAGAQAGLDGSVDEPSPAVGQVRAG